MGAVPPTVIPAKERHPVLRYGAGTHEVARRSAIQSQATMYDVNWYKEQPRWVYTTDAEKE